MRKAIIAVQGFVVLLWVGWVGAIGTALYFGIRALMKYVGA